MKKRKLTDTIECPTAKHPVRDVTEWGRAIRQREPIRHDLRSHTHDTTEQNQDD